MGGSLTVGKAEPPPLPAPPRPRCCPRPPLWALPCEHPPPRSCRGPPPSAARAPVPLPLCPRRFLCHGLPAVSSPSRSEATPCRRWVPSMHTWPGPWPAGMRGGIGGTGLWPASGRVPPEPSNSMWLHTRGSFLPFNDAHLFSSSYKPSPRSARRIWKILGSMKKMSCCQCLVRTTPPCDLS